MKPLKRKTIALPIRWALTLILVLSIILVGLWALQAGHDLLESKGKRIGLPSAERAQAWVNSDEAYEFSKTFPPRFWMAAVTVPILFILFCVLFAIIKGWSEAVTSAPRRIADKITSKIPES